MTPETKEEFKNKAKSWIYENHESIEMNCAFVPIVAIPEDEEDPNMWVFENGSQCDASIGYEMIDLKSDRGEPAVALIFVKGNSWEDLDIYLEDIFENTDEAQKYVDQLGVTYY
jgi:hypothetical protein